jgi:hypothetical protein
MKQKCLIAIWAHGMTGMSPWRRVPAESVEMRVRFTIRNNCKPERSGVNARVLA